MAEATSQATDLRIKLEQYNPANLPTLFVKGPTDYAVFKRLLQLFRPAQAQQVFLVEPPQRAGANYITNMLRSWESGRSTCRCGSAAALSGSSMATRRGTVRKTGSKTRM